MTIPSAGGTRPVVRPLDGPVASVTPSADRRRCGQFAGTREPTIRGHAPDPSRPTPVFLRSRP